MAAAGSVDLGQGDRDEQVGVIREGTKMFQSLGEIGDFSLHGIEARLQGGDLLVFGMALIGPGERAFRRGVEPEGLWIEGQVVRRGDPCAGADRKGRQAESEQAEVIYETLVHAGKIGRGG